MGIDREKEEVLERENKMFRQVKERKGTCRRKKRKNYKIKSKRKSRDQKLPDGGRKQKKRYD